MHGGEAGDFKANEVNSATDAGDLMYKYFEPSEDSSSHAMTIQELRLAAARFWSCTDEEPADDSTV